MAHSDIVVSEVNGLELFNVDIVFDHDDSSEFDNHVIEQCSIHYETQESANGGSIRVPSLVKEDMIVLTHGTVTQIPLEAFLESVAFTFAD